MNTPTGSVLIPRTRLEELQRSEADLLSIRSQLNSLAGGSNVTPMNGHVYNSMPTPTTETSKKTTRVNVFGQALLMAREQKGLSQSAVDRATGVKQCMISAIERGVCRPTMEVLTSLCNFYGVDMTTVLRNHGK